jgi:hypothetical protein
MTQPHADVTAADVERIARRDYPPDRVDEVLSILDEYGGEDWHPEPDRVRMAVLKLAGGKFDQLRMHIEAAKMDFRDVLSEAEYPLYTKKWFHIDKLPEAERQQIIDSDWKQYQDWLTRP